MKQIRKGAPEPLTRAESDRVIFDSLDRVLKLRIETTLNLATQAKAIGAAVELALLKVAADEAWYLNNRNHYDNLTQHRRRAQQRADVLPRSIARNRQQG